MDQKFMTPLQFAPFSSDIELPFYSALFSAKLDYDKLDDSPRQLVGLYEPREADPSLSCRMQILGNAFSGTKTLALGSVRAEGIIKNVNTMENFKETDKSALLHKAGNQIWEAIKDGTIYSIPSLLSSFTILSYADLKRYRFAYWFAFPALHSDPPWRLRGKSTRLSPEESTALVEKVGTWRYSVDSRQRGFFLIKRVPGPDPIDKDVGSLLPFHWQVATLGEFETGFLRNVPEQDQFVSFVDPSTYAENPSWPLRNLLVLVRQRYRMSKVRVICFRDVHSHRHEARSIVLSLETEMPVAQQSVSDEAKKVDPASDMPRVTGWERNASNKLTFKQVNLADYMDPGRLADQSVDLNLKLMKWRITPNLNLDIIKTTRCLLLGAGTLGGYVSRALMAWGVRKITFVDYGTVSYSNPVRQPLFEFRHCENGGEPKAARAAQTLRDIYPGVESEGLALSVPMLGHSFTNEAHTRADFDTLSGLVAAHDVIFLLMDSRESRWLPTVMGKAEGKIVMNAALGFDSFVAMRHGAELDNGKKSTLGCYFCNDIVAPADSMKDQTLDQQCTVTRPGLAAIASGLLVEILVSLLQHPLGKEAPAPAVGAGSSMPGSSTLGIRDPPDHPLGLVPHQVRGYLSIFQNLVIRGESYDCCSACSPAILAAYRADGWEFVRRALLDREYVTQLSGLAEVQKRAEEMAAEVDWDEEEAVEAEDAEENAG